MTASVIERVVAILGYHKIGQPSVGGWETWFYVPEDTFGEHLRDLREARWQVLDVQALLRGLAEPESLPERAAVITFDDGYRSTLDVAVPWLHRFGFPAIVFVPTGFIGGWNRFDVDCEPQEAICNWDDLRELERVGVSVQSHGVWHRRLSELSPEEQEEELCRSKEVLEDGLRKPVELFSFPYGDAGSDPWNMGETLDRAGYRAACLYGGGPNPVPVADPYALSRIPMGPDTDLKAVLSGQVARP
jgi:peptidoglycan/xylan/chitin deacetylase (PgdA/CDA1 family)